MQCNRYSSLIGGCGSLQPERVNMESGNEDPTTSNQEGQNVPERVGEPKESGAPEEVGAGEVELSAALDKLAQGKPQAVREFLAMFSGPMTNPLLGKMDAAHIASMLKIVADHDEREYTLRSREQDQTGRDRAWGFAFFIVVVLLLVFVIVMFKDQPDILFPCIAGIGGIATGFVGGLGLGRSMRR